MESQFFFIEPPDFPLSSDFSSLGATAGLLCI